VSVEFLQFTDFRNKSKEFLDSVEQGNSYVIVRRGKPIARVTPFQEKVQGWKRKHGRLNLKNKLSTTSLLLEERAGG
jgi:prevent-host-death family protein